MSFQICLGYWISHRASVVIHRKLKDGEFDSLIQCFMDKHGQMMIQKAFDVIEPRLSKTIDDKIETIGPRMLENVKNELGSVKGNLLAIASTVARKDRKDRHELADELLEQYVPGAKEMMDELGIDIPGELLLKHGPGILDKFKDMKNKGKALNNRQVISTAEEAKRFLNG